MGIAANYATRGNNVCKPAHVSRYKKPCIFNAECAVHFRMQFLTCSNCIVCIQHYVETDQLSQLATVRLVVCTVSFEFEFCAVLV